MLTMTVKETSLVWNTSGHQFRICNQVESLHFFVGKGDSNCSEGLRFDLYFSCDSSSFCSSFCSNVSNVLWSFSCLKWMMTLADKSRYSSFVLALTNSCSSIAWELTLVSSVTITSSNLRLIAARNWDERQMHSTVSSVAFCWLSTSRFKRSSPPSKTW